jgi:hypothetical protein
MAFLGVAATVLGGTGQARFADLVVLVALSASACGGKVSDMYPSKASHTPAPVDGGAAAAGAGGQPARATAPPLEALPDVECAAPLALPDPALQACFLSSMSEEGLEPASFEALTTLGCEGVATIAGIECLTGLQTLYLTGGSMDDLRPLAGLTELVELGISDSPVRDVSALARLTSIRTLQLVELPLEDIGPLSSCGQRIDWLWLMYDRISDLGPLVASHAIGPWTTVWLGDNPLDCSSQNQDLAALRQRLVTVYTDCGNR